MDWNYKENGEITNYDLAFISNPFYKKDAKVDYIGLFEQIGGDNNEQSKF